MPLSLVEHFADVNKQFVEVLIAPSFSPEALERLSKRTNLNAVLTRFVNSGTGQAAPGGNGYLGGVTASAGKDSTSLALGIRHVF